MGAKHLGGICGHLLVIQRSLYIFYSFMMTKPQIDYRYFPRITVLEMYVLCLVPVSYVLKPSLRKDDDVEAGWYYYSLMRFTSASINFPLPKIATTQSRNLYLQHQHNLNSFSEHPPCLLDILSPYLREPSLHTTMARGNQRDKAREKNQKEAAGQVRPSLSLSYAFAPYLQSKLEEEEYGMTLPSTQLLIPVSAPSGLSIFTTHPHPSCALFLFAMGITPLNSGTGPTEHCGDSNPALSSHAQRKRRRRL